jgi:hypothetical protein
MGQDDPAAVTALKNLKDRVQSEFKKYRGGRSDPRPQRPHHSSDFARLARRICGKSIGIVLGGGGARGIAHLVRPCRAQMTITVTTHFRGYSKPWKSTVYRSIILEVIICVCAPCVD